MKTKLKQKYVTNVKDFLKKITLIYYLYQANYIIFMKSEWKDNTSMNYLRRKFYYMFDLIETKLVE